MAQSHDPSNFLRSVRWNPEPNRQPPLFLGYHRPDGSVGTRNYWLVIPLVTVDKEQLALFQEAFLTVLGYQCPNGYERQLRDLRDQYRAGSYFYATSPEPGKPPSKPLFANIDGIKFLPGYDDSTGVVSEMSPFLDTLADYCTHANVGGATVLSGGEPDDRNHSLRRLIEERGTAFDKTLLVIDRTAYRSATEWLSAATHDTFRAMALLNKQTRRSAPLSRLVIGTQQEETNESLTNQVVDECVQFLTSAGATVLLANPNQPPSGSSVQTIRVSGDEVDMMTSLTAAGCTLHLTPPGLGLRQKNTLAPILTLAPDTEQIQPGEPLLTYLVKLASGELRTPSERGGAD